ncbi:MAG: recombination protein O N-terminal domain-containing protein [Bacteroidales bacterium]|nr:recombination protein O N-terminal domain-containing protein [Bacteroidales bacterium]
MTFADRLIVLNTTKTGDKSLVVHCLSRSCGRRNFIVSAGKNGPAALFLPLNIISAEVVENSRSSLWRLRSPSSESPLAGIRNSPVKNVISLFVSEVLYRILKEGSGDADLFDWCVTRILTLDALTENYSNYHLRFLLELCSAMGFSVSEESIAPFAGEQLKNLCALIAGDSAESLLVPLRGEDRSAIAAILLEYLGYHSEMNLNVRSLPVLREIFS